MAQPVGHWLNTFSLASASVERSLLRAAGTLVVCGGSCSRPSMEGRGPRGWLSLVPPQWGWARAPSRLVRAGPARWPVAQPVGHRLITSSLARWLSLPPRRGRARALWVALAAAPVGVGAGSISRLVRAGTARWPVARPVGHRLNRLSLACGSTRWPSFDTLLLACGIARWPWAGAFMWACGSMAIGSTHAIARLSSREAFTVLAVIVGLSLPPPWG